MTPRPLTERIQPCCKRDEMLEQKKPVFHEAIIEWSQLLERAAALLNH